MANGICKKILFCVFLLCSCGSALLFAGDEEARALYQQGRREEQAKDYTAAAKTYAKAQKEADDVVLQANALQAAARAWRKAKRYGDEFECLQYLVRKHLSRIDFTKVVERQYEIGDEFFKGHRDRFFPWLAGIVREDRTLEVYETALKNAPCAEPAARTRLRLGRLYLDKEDFSKAMQHFSEAVKLNTDPKITLYATLELANIFRQLSARGDGDGKNAALALEAFESFLEKYPDSPEREWVLRAKQEVRENIARRCRLIGDFYYDKKRPEIAERYYAVVVKDYPDTREGAGAEKKLAKIDREYRAKGIPVKPLEKRAFQVMPFPEEYSPVLITPVESGNRYLLPIRDLRVGEEEKTNFKPEITDDML